LSTFSPLKSEGCYLSSPASKAGAYSLVALGGYNIPSLLVHVQPRAELFQHSTTKGIYRI
jgi:hypothetical protein